MNDHPAQTLILTDSPPAHRIRPAQPWRLWMVAALLAAMDVLLIAVIATDTALSPLLVPALLLTGIIASLGIVIAIMMHIPESYQGLGYKLLAAGMAIGALIGVLIYRGA